MRASQPIGLAALLAALAGSDGARADIMRFHPLQNQSASDQYYDYGDCYLAAGQESGLIQGGVASAGKTPHSISRVIGGSDSPAASGTTASIGSSPPVGAQMSASDDAQLTSYEKLFQACMLARGYDASHP